MSVKRITLICVFFIALTMSNVHSVWATAQLTKIGTSAITTESIKQWSYTSENPVLQGTTGPSAVVTIVIDSQTFTTTADIDGDWTYTPTTLTNGSHQVTISEGTTTMTFTLTISPDTVATESATKGGVTPVATSSGIVYPTTLPQSGMDSTPLMLLGGSCILVGAGMYIQRWAQRTA